MTDPMAQARVDPSRFTFHLSRLHAVTFHDQRSKTYVLYHSILSS
jgi:hypothetical protein